MPKAEKERPCLEQGETLVVYMLGAREKGSNYREPVPWPNHHLAQYLPFNPGPQRAQNIREKFADYFSNEGYRLGSKTAIFLGTFFDTKV